MAIGRTEDRVNPWDPVAFEVTRSVWVPVRGIHLGQQFTQLHKQAGHMTASDQISTSTLHHLASRGPSTYGSRIKAGMTEEKADPFARTYASSAIGAGPGAPGSSARRCASTMACEREWTPILRRISVTCAFTVASPICMS